MAKEPCEFCAVFGAALMATATRFAADLNDWRDGPEADAAKERVVKMRLEQLAGALVNLANKELADG